MLKVLKLGLKPLIYAPMYVKYITISEIHQIHFYHCVQNNQKLWNWLWDHKNQLRINDLRPKCFRQSNQQISNMSFYWCLFSSNSRFCCSLSFVFPFSSEWQLFNHSGCWSKSKTDLRKPFSDLTSTMMFRSNTR